MAKKALDFLTKPTTERVRKEIQNICDSYSHSWDLLAELAQNSVDSIRESVKKKPSTAHEISIKIDARTRTIQFRDSGIGLPIDAISDLLAPHGTNKNPNDYSVIGQKGVGLTYVIFNCNDFQLETKTSKGFAIAQVRGASAWRRTGTGKPPLVEVDADENGGGTGTYAQVLLTDVDKNPEDEHDLFNQSAESLAYIIRTKTAIGSTVELFGREDVKVAVSLEHIDSHGKISKGPIKWGYFLPEEFLSKSTDVVDLKDIVGKDLSDKQREAKLRGKCLRTKGVLKRVGRDIHYYAFFVPSRHVWEEFSERNGLTRVSGDEKEHLVTGGIFIGTRGMPTGIELTPPVSGNAGYWPNCFFLLEDHSLTFDLGRKSIPGRTQGLLKEVAKAHFNEIAKLAVFSTGNPSVTGKSGTLLNFRKAEQFSELRKLPELGVTKLPYLKHPDGQEAAVVSIFQQMITTGHLKGYSVLRMGYKSSYDLWGVYNAEKENIGRDLQSDESVLGKEIPTVIEFKVKAEDLIPDLEIKKYFADIDLLVCWDFDEKKLSRNNVAVEPMDENSRLYHGANYRLVFGPSYSLGASSEKPLISLRQFVDSLKK